MNKIKERNCSSYTLMCTMLFETIEFGMPNGTFSRSHVGAILVFEMRSYIKTQNLPFHLVILMLV